MPPQQQAHSSAGGLDSNSVIPCIAFTNSHCIHLLAEKLLTFTAEPRQY